MLAGKRYTDFEESIGRQESVKDYVCRSQVFTHHKVLRCPLTEADYNSVRTYLHHIRHRRNPQDLVFFGVNAGNFMYAFVASPTRQIFVWPKYFSVFANSSAVSKDVSRMRRSGTRRLGVATAFFATNEFIFYIKKRRVLDHIFEISLNRVTDNDELKCLHHLTSKVTSQEWTYINGVFGDINMSPADFALYAKRNCQTDDFIVNQRKIDGHRDHYS
eukprot:Lankesteria_metandrocarpae@DN8440_c1_g1_i1.p1